MMIVSFIVHDTFNGVRGRCGGVPRMGVAAYCSTVAMCFDTTPRVGQ